MDPLPDAAVIGARLRAQRLRRDFTLTEIAARTGISLSTLSRLETGERRPTLELLLPLARLYDVSLDDLVGVAPTTDPRVHGTTVTRHGHAYTRLSRRTDVAAFKVTVPVRAPGGKPVLQTHPGLDWFYVLSGTVRLHLGEAEHVIAAGEAVEFDTLVPHALLAEGDRPAEILHLLNREGERVHVRDVRA